MEYNLLNVTMYMDFIALALSIQLYYYGNKFNTERKFDTLAFQTMVVVSSTFLETIVVIGQLYFPQAYDFINAFEFYTVLFYCVIYATFFKLVYENSAFVPKLSQKTMNWGVLGIYVAALLIAYIFEGKWNYFVDGKFQYLEAKSIIYEGQYIMAGVLLIYCIVFAILGRKKKDRAAVSAAVTGILVLIFGVMIYAIMVAMLGFHTYPSNAILYNISFTFAYLIYNTQTYRSKKEKEHAVAADLENAAQIQLDALPKENPAYPNHTEIDLQTFMATAKEVGGDFYDYYELDDDRVAFLIADVSGKGVPAALFMMNSKNIISIVASLMKGTDKILTEANRIINEKNTSQMFVTVWMGIYDTKTGLLQYTNAGHNPPVIIHQDGSMTRLDQVHGTVLAITPDASYTADTLQIQEGDRFFLYTDGLTEAHNINSEMFGEDRMNQLLEQHRTLSCQDMIQKMKAGVDAFVDKAPTYDDITMVAIQF